MRSTNVALHTFLVATAFVLRSSMIVDVVEVALRTEWGADLSTKMLISLH